MRHLAPVLGGVVDEERPYAHLRRHVEELRDNPADEMRMLPQSLRYHAMHRFSSSRIAGSRVRLNNSAISSTSTAIAT